MDGSGGRVERRKRESRERIVAAAARLFIERGSRAVSVEEVAAAADVARRTLFNYFGGKEELLAAAVAPMLEEAVALVDKALADKALAASAGRGMEDVTELCLGLWRSWGPRLGLLYAVELEDSPRLAALHASFLARFEALAAGAAGGGRGGAQLAGRLVFRCFVPILLALEGEDAAEARFARGLRALVQAAAG